MPYQQDLIERITDSSQWPDFESSDFLSELDAIAEDAFLYNSVYGYLSAILIYHQLCEEVIKLVIRNAEFFIQVSIFPVQIEFPKRDRLTFGKLLQELRATVAFEQKSEVLQKAEELNALRIRIVHKLTKRTSLEELGEEAAKVKRLFEEIFSLCQNANSFFHRMFSDFKKDVDWDEYRD